MDASRDRSCPPLPLTRAACTLVGIVCALSAQLSLAQSSTDVEFLIARIEQSSCQFVRNGKAYPVADAADHLRRKQQAARKDLSPEQFIEQIASKSSISGEPYLIRCKDLADEPSGPWLRRALKERTG